MTTFFNQLGSQTYNGTTTADSFFLFTFNNNLDNLRVDGVLASLIWTTGIRDSASTFFQVTASNIAFSTDLAIGGSGTDIIFGSNGNDAVFYNNGVVAGGFGGFTGIEHFDLAGGDDLIDLSAQGAGGVDYPQNTVVDGGLGNDTIIGGGQRDSLIGRAGDDLIFGYRGADTINGGDGDDLLYGDDLGFNNIAGDDSISGDNGDDTIYGGARSDIIYGGADNDALYGGLGGDTLFGEDGDDLLHGDDPGSSGSDVLNGGAGADTIFGGGGDDEIGGGVGDDVIDGGDGLDFIEGGTGADRIIGGAQNDTIDGDADIDTAVYSGVRADYLVTFNADGSLTIADQRAGAPDGVDRATNIELFEFADGVFAAGDLNAPPVIISDGGGATAARSVEENSSAVTIVVAVDPDAGQTATYSISGGADGGRFSIDAGTGALSFVDAPDFENALDADGDNVYEVVVRASDGFGGFDDQTILVTVTDVADGAAPVITSNGGGATASATVDENSSAVTVVAASDPDSPTVTFRIAGGADAGRFAIDSLTGALSFVVAPDHENPADAGGDNVYDVIVEASDGANTDTQTLSVTVANLNDNSPVITSNGGGATANAGVNENSAAVTTIVAIDADGAAPTYRIAGGADAAKFTIDSLTGALAFIDAPDFENPQDAGGDNVYDVIVEASDGVNTDAQALSVTVANLNDNSPIITSNSGGASAAVNVAENSGAVTTVVATDADGTSPTYRIAGGADAAKFSIDSLTGALSFIDAPDFENPQDAGGDNVYDVIVEAFDGQNADAQAIAVTVTDVNENGVIINGTSGADLIAPTATNPALRTTALNDTVSGLGGADTIDGGAGADSMNGGAGNDVYFVDVFSDDGVSINDDRVTEAAGGGLDTVNASVSYRMADNIEILNLIGLAVSGFGNTLGNGINGNDAANALSGGDGNDTIAGGLGADTLTGDAGNDRLDGGVGADSLVGGLGNDTFFVDVYSDDGDDLNDDLVVEAAGGGTDLVNASVSYRLTANVENLTLTGTAAIDGVGNNLVNAINGNTGANLLSGGLGNDTLRGNAGNDTLNGDDGGDQLFGDAGADALFGGVGVDRLDGGDDDDYLDGGSSGDSLFGQAGADTLVGGGGNDTIVGGVGDDTLIGGVGNDRFEFASGSGADRVDDFTAGAGVFDVIRITGYGAAFDSFGEILAVTTQVGADAVINLGGGNTITLVGVLKTSLVADDFLFV